MHQFRATWRFLRDILAPGQMREPASWSYGFWVPWLKIAGVRITLSSMQIALYQPDIPQNTGTILRLCACMDVVAHIIEPAGFGVSDRLFRRSGMDYLDQVNWVRHDSWTKFEEWRRQAGHRLLLFTTKGATPYLDFAYQVSDILLFGRETAGVPQAVAEVVDARLVIPLKPGLRSLNVAMAAAMALGEALRQTRQA
jgi:tRNA (cytidine/uridine-2'-O-)-methyltransferase